MIDLKDQRDADGGAAYRAVLWDLDGTLIDTEPLYYQALAEVCAGYGHEFTEADHVSICGRDGAATFAFVMERFGLPLSHGELRDVVTERFLRSVGAHHARPEAVAIVRALAGRGVPQACVSNSPTHMIRHHLELLAIDHAFGCLIGRDQVERGKPHPDPYLLACTRLGVPPAACLAVEDTPTGVAAARAAGATVIACPTAMTARLDFAEAHHRVERLVEFPWGLQALAP